MTSDQGTYTPGQATLYTTREQMSTWGRAQRKVGKPVVLVPTMGALHQGHLALVKAAQNIPGAQVVVSIFVNPTQFGPTEDLDAYPRALDEDMEKLKAAGVDVVFAPSAQEMYPHGLRTAVLPGEAGRVLEGATRPTHFAGVLTVVNKLFNITHCSHAVCGEKDYQQLVLIQHMVTDLNMEVEIRSVPIVREADGLALSSRNRYLSPEEREHALAINAALTAASFMADKGPEEVLKTARDILENDPAIDLDYVELRDLNFNDSPRDGDARLLAAAKVGTTRLIDNVGVILGLGFKGLEQVG